MLLLSGGNMFKRKEKELKERIEKLERDVEYWQASCSRMYDIFYQESLKNAATLLPTIEKQKKELEEQKQIAAKHVSMYYDVVQKLKTVMEETNYGQNL